MDLGGWASIAAKNGNKIRAGLSFLGDLDRIGVPERCGADDIAKRVAAATIVAKHKGMVEQPLGAFKI